MYVYANNDGLVLNEATGGSVMLRPGDVWFADDPFVLSRPDLFSATPTLVHSTQGRQPLSPTPVVKPGTLTVTVDDSGIAPVLADALRAGGRPRGRRA